MRLGNKISCFEHGQNHQPILLKKNEKEQHLVTELIRNTKRKSNFLRKIGPNPLNGTIYQNLRCHPAKNRKDLKIPDVKKFNEYFARIGSSLSKIRLHDENVKISESQELMV